MFLDMSGTGEPHRGLGRLFVRKRTRWPHLCAPTPWSGNNRGRKTEPTTSQTKHGAPCAVDGAHGVGGVLHWKCPASSRSPSSSSLSPPSLPSCPWACPVLVSVEVLPLKPHAPGQRGAPAIASPQDRLYVEVLVAPLEGTAAPAAGILEFGPAGCPYAGSPQVPVPMVTLR